MGAAAASFDRNVRDFARGFFPAGPIVQTLYTKEPLLYAILNSYPSSTDGKAGEGLNASVYELLALAMRYWFIALMAAIVFLLAQSFLREWRIEKAVQRRIASAASLYALRLVSSEDRRLEAGLYLPLEGDVLLGSGRGCDLRLKTRSLQRRHLVLRPERDGVLLFPEGNALVAVEGERVRKLGKLLPGQRMQAGGLLFELRAQGEEEEDGPWQGG